MKKIKNSPKNNIGYILKRFFIAVSAILFAFLLGGCTEAEIRCGVTEDAEAYINILVEAECGELPGITLYDVYDTMNLIRYYYVSELGYEGNCTSVTEENDKVILTLRKSDKADSIADALDKLKSMLEDGKTSIFSAATLEKSGGETEQGYSLSLTLRAEDILSEEQFEYLPAHGREMVESEILGINAVLSVVLPSTELTEFTGHTVHEGAFVTAQVPISLDSPTEISLKTKVSFDENGIPMTLEEKNEMMARLAEKSSSEFAIAVICGAAALCTGIIIAVVVIKIKKRSALTSVTEENTENGVMPGNENTEKS